MADSLVTLVDEANLNRAGFTFWYKGFGFGGRGKGAQAQEGVGDPLQQLGYSQRCLKSVQSALSDLKRLPERLQSQCNYRPFIT